MKGYAPETFGERMAEGYDAWYGNPSEEETLEAVSVLADLAAGGRVLELAIGTGRVAVPLAARGLAVEGIEASEAMIAKLREKTGGDAIPVSVGNLADVDTEGEFELVYLVFNTLFNLTTQDEQVRCFGNVARHLSREGVFVVEAFVPDIAGLKQQDVRTRHVSIDSTILEASVHDPITQLVSYQYIVITPEGVEQFPVPQRYAWPSELDLMARFAGLELRERWAGWDRSPFTASSTSHVSVYGRSRLAGEPAQ
jgi:SAM-dependent methyltransferase